MSREKRPNIVIFNPDQMRADALAHLGNPASVTPNFDRMAREDGVSLRNAFAQNPVCTPSRCSFMSGWYPHVRGHRTMYHMMRDGEPVLLKNLKDQGYFVWTNTRNDLLPAQIENIYDEYCDIAFRPTKPFAPPPEGQGWRGEPGGDRYYSFFQGEKKTAEDGQRFDLDAAWVDGALAFIRNRPRDKPFCLFLPLIYPHPPYGVEEPWFSLIDRSKMPDRIPTPENWQGKASVLKGLYELQGLQGWTEERWTELRATYLGMVSRVDHQFGLVVDALKEEGVYDDTAVFAFSDHGDYTGDYGIVEKTQNSFEDTLTNVPFIIKPPVDVEVKPGIRDALVELIDFYATVEDFSGITSDHTHFGRSLRAVLSGEASDHRDAVFCEGGRLQNEEHCMEKQSSPDLDSKNEYYPRMKLQRSEGPEHTKAVMCRTSDFKYVRRLYETDELYDLNSDPRERDNRIADPALKGVLLELKDRLLTFFLETGDVVPHDSDQRFGGEDIKMYLKMMKKG
ncbi:MAG: sulfatase-like hydrolase/transferase [Proteobacteria bacterium]|nr:sulfatase-like hydrolase/transferase [Pseudomonadota bacterium]